MSKAQGKATLKTALKVDDMAYVVTVDGTPWIGTRYWAAQVGETATAFLSQYNIPVAPARFTVNGSATLTDGPVPGADTVATAFGFPTTVRELTPATFHGDPIIVERGGIEYAAYVSDDDADPVYVSRLYVSAVVGETGDPVQVCQGRELGPVHFVGTGGRGVVMPIRR